ncbi:hypothetical protein ATE47_00455 [Chryseobacterium sp. IHB B 17019]|uniref:hypothetical protein n=1 Tax=Chryseobacterium sp. IHB B 17019 TaxID=1721091 RepID=UPI00071FA07E|nr:hypothetical protein [Chryseobacterium sp. IHB B 17019]ALR29108.1 hypothetical protein ATE47_00455 [Chryseobacterium sp. IHB B 17019]
MSIKRNKARKSKLDLVASMIEERNIKWSHRNAGRYFIFEIQDAEIHVSHDEIKMIKNGIVISYFDDRFDNVLSKLEKPLN